MSEENKDIPTVERTIKEVTMAIEVLLASIRQQTTFEGINGMMFAFAESIVRSILIASSCKIFKMDLLEKEELNILSEGVLNKIFDKILKTDSLEKNQEFFASLGINLIEEKIQ